ncbi:MAG: glycosyltransferase family 4 protein [Planctomycetota bacterium]|jgi:glycosyltransferase involved in cell wall biosynthesis
MKTFMLGWEFPPYISGGLGTACHGLTKAMGQLGIQITFVLPKAGPAHYAGHVKMLCAHGQMGIRELSGLKNVSFRTVPSALRPYVASGAYQHEHAGRSFAREWKSHSVHSWSWSCSEHVENYGHDMYQEVQRYAKQVAELATIEDFDIVHAHDWMTYPAGIIVAEASGKPLVVHVHSTEFDRSGEHVNQMVYDIERHGMHVSAKVIAVSNYTKNIIISRYGIAPEKVEVVYNGVQSNINGYTHPMPEKTDKIVLFLGRITMQKGPEYFLAAAKRVLEKINNVKFVMAGDGDMLHRTVELTAQMGLGRKVMFTRFLRGSDVERIYQMADLYVMPSVSEPFGIAPLEALQHDVPVLISKQSGIAEVLKHALKVDFWDINQMANKIIAVLRYPPLSTALSKNGRLEAHRFRWEDSATRVKEIYKRTLAVSA